MVTMIIVMLVKTKTMLIASDNNQLGRYQAYLAGHNCPDRPTGIKSNGRTNQRKLGFLVRGENRIESPQKTPLEQNREATLPQPAHDTKPRIELGTLGNLVTTEPGMWVLSLP